MKDSYALKWCMARGVDPNLDMCDEETPLSKIAAGAPGELTH